MAMVSAFCVIINLTIQFYNCMSQLEIQFSPNTVLGPLRSMDPTLGGLLFA